MGCSLRRWVFCLAAGLVVVASSSDGSAAVVIGDRATFHWSAASGPIVGYNVFVIRDGVPSPSPEITVSVEVVTVTGHVDEQIAVQVAAFDSAGNQGPLSSQSETVLLAATPAPSVVTTDAFGDFSILDALSMASPGEQVVAHMRGTDKQFLDSAPDSESNTPPEDWGLDQLIVGEPFQPAEVRLVDALRLDEQFPLEGLPQVNLFGLGTGAPCERDGDAGLVIHAGSRLILGGIDLFAFDGDSCVYVNDLFLDSADPNRIAWGDGEIQLHGDIENDGVLDPDDNCLLAANADQCDGDRDGFGNACDADVNGNNAGDLDDVRLVLLGSRASSHDPALDLNCDGAVGMDDVGLAMRGQAQIQGPSGLACAVDATCF